MLHGSTLQALSGLMATPLQQKEMPTMLNKQLAYKAHNA
jgi:hypothetical protein